MFVILLPLSQLSPNNFPSEWLLSHVNICWVFSKRSIVFHALTHRNPVNFFPDEVRVRTARLRPNKFCMFKKKKITVSCVNRFKVNLIVFSALNTNADRIQSPQLFLYAWYTALKYRAHFSVSSVFVYCIRWASLWTVWDVTNRFTKHYNECTR